MQHHSDPSQATQRAHHLQHMLGHIGLGMGVRVVGQSPDFRPVLTGFVPPLYMSNLHLALSTVLLISPHAVQHEGHARARSPNHRATNRFLRDFGLVMLKCTNQQSADTQERLRGIMRSQAARTGIGGPQGTWPRTGAGVECSSPAGKGDGFTSD